MGEADKLRKAMGKKKVDLMATMKDKFVIGAGKNMIRNEIAQKIFDEMAQFAEYGFNKSHAAVYAFITYQTAWLKAHYPVEFFASLITTFADNTDDVVAYLKECEEKKIPVDPPHVNHSEWGFRADGDRLRIGLCAVKGVGEGAARAVIEGRSEKPYASIFDLCERVDLKRSNRKALESLIKAGALDDLGAHRAQLMAVLDQALEQGHSLGREREAGQTSLFDILGDSVEPQARGERYPDIPPWPSNEVLAQEKLALGFYLTGHPLTHFEDMMRRYGILDTARLPYAPDGQEVLVGGVVTGKKEILTKKKERMAFITLTDLKGNVEVVVFSSVFRESVSLLEKSDLPLLVRGRVDVGEDRVKLLASEIMPLEEASQRLSVTLHLTVRRPQASREQIALMSNTLRLHPGRSRVVVHVVIPEKSEAIISLPMDLRVNATDELVRGLEDLFGEESVRLETAGVGGVT